VLLSLELITASNFYLTEFQRSGVFDLPFIPDDDANIFAASWGKRKKNIS